MDDAWQVLKQSEHKAMVDRARTMQLQGNEKVRRLHSQLFQQSVFAEVAKQIEYKQRQKQVWEQWSKDYVTDIPFCPAVCENIGFKFHH